MADLVQLILLVLFAEARVCLLLEVASYATLKQQSRPKRVVNVFGSICIQRRPESLLRGGIFDAYLNLLVVQNLYDSLIPLSVLYPRIGTG